MRKVKFNIVILVFVCNLFAQEQIINQTEKLDIAQIQQKAKVDAKSDFNTLKKLGWGGASIAATLGGILSSLVLTKAASIIGLMAIPIASHQMPVNLPQEREKELSSKSDKHQAIYHLAYESAMKKQRLKYSLASPPACLGLAYVAITVMLYMIWHGGD